MSAPRTANSRGQGERLRAELLTAATALMAAPRPVQVPSLRAVARAAGVAPSAVYLQFDSGRALATAVVEDLFADLRREIDAADDPAGDPVGRLRATAHALAAWARRRPGAYQMLFEAPDPGGSGPASDHGPGLDLLDRVVRFLVLSGRSELDGRRLALRVWAALHGLISLRLHKPQDLWVEPLDGDVDDVLAALIR